MPYPSNEKPRVGRWFQVPVEVETVRRGNSDSSLPSSAAQEALKDACHGPFKVETLDGCVFFGGIMCVFYV